MAVEITVIPVGRAQVATVHVVSDEDVRDDVASLLSGSDWVETSRQGQITVYRSVAL